MQTRMVARPRSLASFLGAARRCFVWPTLLLTLVALVGCAEPIGAPGVAPASSSLKAPGQPRAARAIHAAPPSVQRDASDEFFENQKVVALRVRLDEPQMVRLREEPRAYVRGTLIENDSTTYADVGVKLKGAAGSFQGLDDRPALTLNMNKFREKQSFHALDKFHLNNSVQDGTYACESICSDLSVSSGIPATRVTHARVWINDRDLGLYVLKEGFDKPFLKRHFAKPNGNLYDGGFLRDVDADLEKDMGDGPDDFSDLKSLAMACREPDPARRWALVANSLDIDSFVRFMALELMTCHWDGYTRNRNNYRIYFDPSDSKARFLAHGMDQMFSDPGFSVLEYPDPMVSRVVMQNPAWRKLYRQRLQMLLPFYSAEALTKKLDAIRAKLQPTLAAISADADRNHADRCRELRERLVARAANLREQVKQSEPTPVEFDEQGRLAVEDWEPRQESEDAALERVERNDKVEYTIVAGPSGSCIASWRRKVLLAQGRYRVEARVKTTGVAPLNEDQGKGAGVRISGGKRPAGLTGDTDWTLVTHEFVVMEPTREVELVAELRATKGRAAFQSPLRLVRIAEAK